MKTAATIALALGLILPVASYAAEAPKAKVVLSEKQMDRVTAGGGPFGSVTGSVVSTGITFTDSFMANAIGLGSIATVTPGGFPGLP